MTFLVFIFLAFYVKKRQRIFRQNEKTQEEYLAHMRTNYNSLRFSLSTSRVFLIAGLLDLLLLLFLPAVILAVQGNFSEEEFALTVNALQTTGLGGSIMLIPMIPLMLLFSYTRTYKNRTFDALLPFGGIALIIAVYIEGSYQALSMMSYYFPTELAETLRRLVTMTP